MIKLFKQTYCTFFLFLLLIISGFSNYSFSQLDSLKTQEVEGVTVSVTKKKEIVFSEFDSYIMDITHSKGYFYVLMREIFDHHLVRLDEGFNTIDTLDFSFHPLEVLESCQKEVLILSKDSLFVIGLVDDKMQIISRKSKILYTSFFKDCMGNIDHTFYMRSIRDLGNSTFYHSLKSSSNRKELIYAIIDSTMRRSDQEELRRNRSLNLQNELQAKEIDSDQLSNIRKKQDQAAFFQNIKKRPTYHPLFVFKDTLYIFDHLNKKRITLDKNGNILYEHALSDSLNRLWNDKIYMDEESGEFYAVNIKNGGYTLLRIDINGDINYSVKLTGHAYPDNIFILHNYVYFTDKVDIEDNLNKLFRQRL